jgi:hypothetical protein
VQAELFLNFSQERAVRLPEAHPYEYIGLFHDLTDIVDSDVAQPLTRSISDTVDHHARRMFLQLS